MLPSKKFVLKSGNYYSVLKTISQSDHHNKKQCVAGFSSVSDQNKATREREKHSKKNDEDNMVDLARDMGGSAAEIAKTGMVGALETGLMLGDMAKHTMDGMWGLTKKTVETVRDSIMDPHHHHQHRSGDVKTTSSSDDSNNKSFNGKKKNVDKVFVDHSGKDESKDDKHVDLI